MLLEPIDKVNDIRMYLHGDVIRFDVYKRRKEALNDEYIGLVFNEILVTLTTNYEKTKVDNDIGRKEINKNYDYYAREGLMEKIEMILFKTKRLCLFGVAGVGKTTVANEYSNQQIDKFNKQVLLFDSENKTKILLKMKDFMKKIIKEETDLDDLKRSFHTYVNKSQNLLIVFDNLCCLDDVNSIFKLETIKAPILITTRINKINNLEMIELFPFKIQEGNKYLTLALPQLCEEAVQIVIKECADEDGGLLPCKLSLTVGILKQYEKENVEKVLQESRFRGYIVKLMKELELERNDCIKLLKVATLIDPYYVSIQFLKLIKWQNSFKVAIQKLSNFLTPVYSNTPMFGIKLNRMIYEDLKIYFQLLEGEIKIENEMIVEVMEILNNSLKCFFENDDSLSSSFIFHAIKILEFNETSETLLAAELFEKIGRFYEIVTEEYEKALEYTEKCLEIKLKHYENESHPSLADTIAKIGTLCGKLGDDTKAFEYTKRGLDARGAIYCGNHVDIAQSLSDLAICHRKLRNDNKALEYAKKALEMRKHLYLGNHPQIAQSLDFLGECYNKLEQGNKGLEYTNSGLVMRERLYSGNHPDVAKSLCSVAGSYRTLGNYKKFLEFTKKSHAMKENMYSGNHPCIAQSLLDLAEAYSSIDDENTALKYTKKSLEMREQLFTENHSSIAQSLNALAISYRRLGKENLALEYFKKALSIRREVFTGNHPDLIESIDNLADFYKQIGNVKESSALNQEISRFKQL